MLVEHARTLCGIADATHAEYGRPGTPIIGLLACSLADTTIEVTVTVGSRLAAIVGAAPTVERTTCNYGLDPAFQHLADTAGLCAAAVDDTGEVRAVERPDHPFFVATLYQPQLSSTATAPHQLLVAFVGAMGRRAAAGTDRA